MPRVAFADEARRIAANIAKLPERTERATKYNAPITPIPS